MPNYKVGDVAALFPKPKKPVTETQKKLQSLFEEFNNLKKESSKNFENRQKEKKTIRNEITGNQDQRNPMKKKKRKFSELSSPEPNSVINNKKKYNQTNEQEVVQVADNKVMKTTIDSYSKDFPRKKKAKLNNSNKMTVDDFNVSGEFSHDDDIIELDTVSANTKYDKMSGFIKKSKSKHVGIASSKPNSVRNDKKKYNQTNEQVVAQVADIEIMKKTVDSDSKDFPRKKKAKLNKSNKNTVDDFNVSGVFSLDDDDDVIELDTIRANTKCDKMSGFIKKSKQIFGSKNTSAKTSHDISLIENTQEVPVKHSNADNSSDDLFKTENVEFVENNLKKFKKKKMQNKSNGLMQTSQSEVQKEALDFIKLKPSPDDSEVLSRTLFVGNLPVDTTRKDIEKLFCVFGPIDFIRFKPIESDRKKIFKQGDPKTFKNSWNYAAESVPGFVIFKERQHAVQALSLSGSIFHSNHITVDFAMPAGSKKFYDENRSIFIGNLPFDTNDESVWNAFADCGKIEGVRVVKDRETGVGKGFGYVLFNSVQGKENALASEDIEIQGRTIRISAVKSNKKTQKKPENAPAIRDSFKGWAIKYKKTHKDSGSRKSVNKIMKKQKALHKKKKIASFMQKSMK